MKNRGLPCLKSGLRALHQNEVLHAAFKKPNRLFFGADRDLKRGASQLSQRLKHGRVFLEVTPFFGGFKGKPLVERRHCGESKAVEQAAKWTRRARNATRYEPFADLPARVSYARVESEMGAEAWLIRKQRDWGHPRLIQPWPCFFFFSLF